MSHRVWPGSRHERRGDPAEAARVVPAIPLRDAPHCPGKRDHRVTALRVCPVMTMGRGFARRAVPCADEDQAASLLPGRVPDGPNRAAGFTRDCGSLSTNSRTADDRLPSRSSSMRVIRAETLTRSRAAICLKQFQNSASRLMLVLCPRSITERLNILDFMAATRMATTSRKATSTAWATGEGRWPSDWSDTTLT